MIADVAGIKTHVVREGRGEPVILLHGLGASSYSWRFVVPELARRFEVFAPDFPGFGRSGKPWDFDYSIPGLHRWLLSFLDALGIEKARFAGNSMGGAVTLWTALEAEPRVERMALLGTPAYPENRPRVLWPLRWPVIGSLFERALGETILRAVARSTFVDQTKVTEELIAEYSAPLKTAEGRRAVAQFVRRAIPPDWKNRVAGYARVNAPALVIVGDADRMVDRPGGERLAADLPRARFHFMDRCGHAPQEDAPERVVPLLRDFFAAAALCLAAAFLLTRPAAAAPKNPGAYVELSRSDDLDVDPARVGDGASRRLASTVYETLVALKPGSIDEYEPRLSTAVPGRENGLVSADGKTWRFPIRTGVRFHDGGTLTPEDVRFSLLRRFVATASEGLPDELVRVVLGLEIDGARPPAPADVLRLAEKAVSAEGGDVVVRLARPSPSFLAILASDGYVLSKEWCAAQGDWDGTEAGLPRLVGPRQSRALMNAADGTGPFKLERWDRSQREIVFVRNDAYWRGPAKLRRAIVKAVPETATRVMMLKNGDADSIAASVVEEPLVKGLPGVKIFDGFRQPNRNSVVFFNFRIDPSANPDMGSGKLDGDGIPADFFQDRDVRLGFANALDARRYIRDVLRGRGRVASGFLPPGLAGYSETGLEFGLNRRAAERHFRRAFGGKLWEKGFRMTVLVNAGSAWRPALVEILRRELRSINPKFRLETRVVDWPTLLDRAGKHMTTLYVQGVWEPAPDALLYARALLHGRGRMASRMGYANPEADRLVEAAEAEANPGKREEILRALQKFAHDDCPFVPVAEARGDVLRVHRAWVKGYRFTPFYPGAPETADFYELSKE